MKYTKKDFTTSITGFFMAIADSVPGVSGGTIVYIAGKYEDFVGSIAGISRKSDKEKIKKSIDFLIKLILGWVLGMGISISIIASLFEQIPYQLISLFFGFVLISIPFIIKEESLFKKISILNLTIMFLSIALVVAISSFSSSSINFNDERTLSMYLYLFFVGAIAICAMVLPGISGSTFLLIFGVYVPIVNAVKSVLKFDFTYLDLTIVFGLGVLIGLGYFSRIIKYLFENYRAQTIFSALGLLIGSLYSIIVGPTSLTDAAGNNLNLSPLNLSNVDFIWLLMGISIIVLLEWIRLFKNKKESK